MGYKQDAEEQIEAFQITRIHGQPTDEDIDKLVNELTECAATIPTTNGGGSHGHMGMLIKDAEYPTFSTNGEPFTIPTNPGAYPLNPDNDAIIRERQVAEHKLEVKEFETYLGVANGLRKKIREAVDPEWLESIRHTSMGFAHLTPKQMIDHLLLGGAVLDYMDVSELNDKLTEPWDGIENPATKFARDDIIERQLIKAGLPNQQPLRLALILARVKSTGEYDNAVREWDNKPAADKTFANFRPFITIEFTKRNKSQDTAKNAGFGIANAAAALQEQQIQLNQAAESALAYAALAEAMKDSQKESMENMMKMFKDILGTLPTAAGNGTPATNGQRPKCPHCNRRHIKHEECWELEANASKRPANWKPAAERKKKDT
eukprot:CCRYP_007736-RA/>CCRYP_007736-RA protein AED:0.38 eAED:0.38 QI:0/-1/0/1/-1/1/1/0/375